MVFPPTVNFTNLLRAAFTLADPKSAKKLLDLTVFCTLLVSAHVKAAHRTLMKLTPVVNFTNILRPAFSYKSVLSSFLYLQFGFVFFWRKNIGAKAARRTLVKLTPKHVPKARECVCDH